VIGPILSLALAALAQGPSLSDPIGMPVTVQAASATSYAVKCHVRTYKTKAGVLANTFTIINKGPYKDEIPSPNAQCQLWKTAGPGVVTLHILKGGDHAATVADVGKPVPLQVW
jgi:hypothetical protein